MIDVEPGANFTGTTEPGIFATGRAGQIGVRIERADGTTHTARTVAGIVELEAGSTAYAKADLVAPTTKGTYILIWDDAGSWASEELRVTYTPGAAVVPTGPGYASATDLRAELGLDVAALSDAAANKLLRDAEDVIDSWLGGWPLQESGTWIGRKISADEVTALEWSKLNRATVKLAAHFHRDASILRGPEWEEISGPDFSTKVPAPTLRKISDVIAPLNASGLRRLGAHAS